jgi:hypothetical protein
MASGGVAVASSAGLFASVPYVGWIVGIAAAYIDATYLYPKLAGDGPKNARPPILQGVPVGSNEAGSPRISAYGKRCRVPTHILWQTSKTRETQSAASTVKGGTTTTLRRVYIDALVSLNDRKTSDLIQLVGNGKLILYKTRNVSGITTSGMRADYDSGGVETSLSIQMASTSEQSFVERFSVGDLVLASDFVHEGGDDTLNNDYFEVIGVQDHTPSAPSTISVAPRNGQTIVSSAYNGGSPFTPASLVVVRDAMLLNEVGLKIQYVSQTSSIQINSPGGTIPTDAFSIGTEFRVYNARGDADPSYVMSSESVWRVTEIWANGGRITAVGVSGPGYPTGPHGGLVSFGPRQAIICEQIRQQLYSSGIFPSDYSPSENFYDGREDQGEHPLVVADKGTGFVPAWRGVAFQALEQFYATAFGDQLPYSLEALIEPDSSMTWGEVSKAILESRGVPRYAVNTDGVPTTPFGGIYVRGSVAGISAIQPLLIAGQILGQERDGVISLFTVDKADVVQVENGAEFSDLGIVVGGGRSLDDKLSIDTQSEEDLPTSIGIRHQDPDNQFAAGYQHFGLRNPAGVHHQNEQEIDLSNVVLSRKEARNLASTILRRAWVNRTRYRFTLPAAYIDLLENDLVTLTTDDGELVRCRIVQRDIGADFSVAVTALSDDFDLGVYGSPVQSGSGLPSPIIVTPAQLKVITIDGPGVRNSEVATPGIKFAICAQGGGANWGGVAVYESVDGASYQSLGVVGNQAAIATLDTALSAQDPSEEYGTTTVTVRAQTVDVTFDFEGSAAIEAATKAEAEAGKNWCAIVSGVDVEIAAFTTVVPNGNRGYTLGGWLRGLRGTSSPEQGIGFQLVMLHPAQDNVFFREFPGSVLPTSLAYKFVPFGSSIDDATAGSVTATWRNARPLPVRSVTKTIGASPYDARLEVDAHWTRQLLPLGTQPPHQMDEPFEAYRFDIYDPTGVTLLRSKTITAQGSGSSRLRDKWVTYTAAEQTADGYTPSASETFFVDVVQIGEFGDSPSILAEI